MTGADAGAALRVRLRQAQTVSAVGLGLFLGVHLAVPVVSGVRSVDSGERVLLLGRVYYASGVGEGVLWVLGGVHVLCGLVRRRRRRWTAHAVAGWMLVPLVAHHVLLNRVAPPHPVDLAHVGTGLASFPAVTYTLYATLLAAAATHVSTGLRRIAPRTCTRTRTRTAIPTSLAALLAGLGLIAIHTESHFTPHRITKHILHTYTSVWPYSRFST